MNFKGFESLSLSYCGGSGLGSALTKEECIEVDQFWGLGSRAELAESLEFARSKCCQL